MTKYYSLGVKYVTGPVSEVNDFVEALYEALPKHRQTARNFVERGEVLYRYFDELDWEEALQNVVVNQVVDHVVGTTMGKVRKKARKANPAADQFFPLTQFMVGVK